MGALAELLLKHQVCSSQQIAKAQQNQVLLGGRLGTNLIELGAIDEKTLAQGLARVHRVETLYGEGIEPEREAMRLISASDVDRFDVIPYKVGPQTLKLLCLDPHNFTAFDEMAFKTGKKPQPIVVPEVRFWQLLRRYYAIDRGLRGFALAGLPSGAVRAEPQEIKAPVLGQDLMSEDAFDSIYQRPVGDGDDVGDHENDTAAPAPLRTTTAQLPVLTGTVVDEAGDAGDDAFAPAMTIELQEVVLDEEVEDAPAQPPTPPASRTQHIQPLPPELHDETPIDFARATELLASVRGRDEVAHSVLRFAGSIFKRAMLFTVHGSHAVGWDEVGVDIPRGHFKRVAVALTEPSIFKLVCDSRAHVLGSLEKTPTNIQFLAVTGKQVPRSVFAMPIIVGDRVVNVFYGDNGHKQHCPSDVGELLILALKIRQSYEALLAAKAVAGAR